MLGSLQEAKTHFQNHDRVRPFILHSSNVHSVAWNVDGTKLASGSLDKNVVVSSLTSYRLKQDSTCKGHEDQVDQVAWHATLPDVLASASGDKSVRIWDVRKKQGVRVIRTKGQNINVVWAPNSPYLAVGDKDDRVSIYDGRTWKLVHTEQFKTETNEFAWDPTGKYLWVCGGGGEIPIFKFPEMTKVLTLQASSTTSLCLSIKMDPAAKHFAVGGHDALISIWDLRELVCLRTIDRLDWPVRTVGFSWDGQLVAGGSEDHSIDISWVETGEQAWDLKCDGSSYSLAWHPREYLLAFSCEERPSQDIYSSRTRESGNVKLFGLSPDQL